MWPTSMEAGNGQEDISPVQAVDIPCLWVRVSAWDTRLVRFLTCVIFSYFFSLSLFYLKEMLTMATSKQIPNQPSLGTIQEVTVLCLASLCEPMCPSPKPGNYIWHLWEEMSCLSHETCSAEVSGPTSASSEASLTAPARAQLNLGGEACSGVHGSLSMDPSPPVRARASWKSCPWSHL